MTNITLTHIGTHLFAFDTKDSTCYRFDKKKNFIYSVESVKILINKLASGDSVKLLVHNGTFSSYLINNCPVRVMRNFNTDILQKNATKSIMYTETAKMYNDLILPNISETEWVLKIFDGSAEKETVYIKDKDFYLLPDPKWDRKISNVYLLALCTDKNLYSIRDLRGSHIELLIHIRQISLDYISDHYGVSADQIRCFIHYYPSAWRLHVHFQHVDSDISLGSNIQAGRAHLLSSVISNLEIDKDYYAKITMESIVSSYNLHKLTGYHSCS